MSEHIPMIHNSAPLNDVEMEDFSEITNALVAAIPTNEPNEAQDQPRKDIQVRDFAQVSPADDSIINAKEEANDDMDIIAGATQAPQAPQATTPIQRNGPLEQAAGPARSNDPAAEDEAANLRYELFCNMFANQVVELKDFTEPKECAQYPEHANEILGAYLSQTTFTVKIWTNFDAAEQVFFEGARAADCGKLQVPQKKLEWLLGLDKDDYDLDHIRLDIGTPFRTLANIFLDVHYDDDGAYLEVRAAWKKSRPPLVLGSLRDFLDACIDFIKGVNSDRSLDMDDLVKIATLFRRRRLLDDGDDADWEEPAYEGGEWAGIEKKETPSLWRKSRWAVE